MEVRIGDNFPDEPDTDDVLRDLDEDGYTTNEGDCDDLNPLRGPVSDPVFVEQCDGVDNDCSGVPDETNDGLLACAGEASFTQRVMLDLVLLVDRSPRTTDFRSVSALAVDELLRPLMGGALYDTHIGVLSTDLEDATHSGHLLRPDGANRSYVTGRDALSTGVSFVRSVLTEMEDQEEGANGGRAAVMLAFDEATETTNAGFFRPNTPLAIVVVSAIDDLSASPTLTEFVDFLDASADTQRIHAIVQTSPFGCVGKESGIEGTSYLDLATLTNGFNQSVCEENYQPFFSAIGQYSAIQGLASRYPLGEAVEGDSMEVTLTLPGDMPPVELRADEFALSDADQTLVLLLDPPPPVGTSIQVSYLRKY